MIKYTPLLFTLTMCAPAPVTPPAQANDLMQDYNTLVEFARRNVQYEKKQKKLETLDEDIYSAILEYYNHPDNTPDYHGIIFLKNL